MRLLLDGCSFNESTSRGRCERIFDIPFRPPGLSVASFIRASRSMRPALRNALEATTVAPGAAATVENIAEYGLCGGFKRERGRCCATGRCGGRVQELCFAL